MDNSTHHNEELLIRYLDGDLSAEEKNILEQRLKQNKELADELESLQLAREAIRNYGLKQQVRNIHSSIRKQIKAPVRQMSRGRKFARYSLAAAASLLIIMIGVLGYNFYTLSPAKIFNANYQPYELSNVRDGGTTKESGIEQAFRNKEFSKVAELGKGSVQLSQRDRFLAGVANAETGNFTSSIDHFKKLLATNQATNTDTMMAETEFYLALVYIRNRDYDQAVDLMTKIHDNPTHPYHEKISGKLIRKVKMLKWR